MITYQQEFLCQVRKDIEPLLEKDWLEIEHEKNVRKLNPNWGLYEALEGQGALAIFTARSDKTLIGYFVAITMPSLHNQGITQSMADVIYLDKQYRKGLIGYKMFRFAEKCLAEDGSDILHVTTTEVNPIDSLMQRLGYSKTETKFEKVLQWQQ